ncbi:phage lysis regulatory protein [uncultured phage cr151_1]|uniref:Phage lysis regulatory protein n=1 Tax=uncultured phage cr151_1 TaxID=2986406 RepID=A0AAE7RWP3_9CAUD|nr:phage lysis regulatory protein [uncultured phage cr151_1]QWM89459.1 phage lysis regulatory protein [uncultured phage cr151_1]
MKRIITLIILALIAGISYLYTENLRLNHEYKIAAENIKAYDAQLSGLEGDNRVLKLTVEQLNYFNDSIIKKIKEAQKELNIKDSKLKQAQYELSFASRKDTILLKDTIFSSTFTSLDTIMGDKWFSNRIQLSYPNLISSSVSFKSEKFCFVQLRKETIKPPKKFFLARWFQKKHYVSIVTIKENNPYIEIKNSRFIQIIE